MGSSSSPLKKTYKEAYADRDQKLYGGLNEADYTAEAKRQNKSYKETGKWDTPKEAMKSEARGEEVDTTKKNKLTGRTTTTATDDKGAVDTTVTRKDGSVKKTVDQTNLSTYDAEKGTGSSGMGIKETTKKYKRSGKPKKRTKTTYSMGTDTKKDDKKVTTKVGKRKQKTKEIDPTAGTVTKTKHFTKGKKAGTSKTRVREKGKIFGKKVNVDYS